MPSQRTVLLIGACLAAGLALLVVVGVAAEQWVLAAVGGSALLAAQLMVQVDTWRRTRVMRNYLRDEIRRASLARPELAAPMIAPSTATPEDVVGAVRLLQAQYVGRLDRMQTTLDEAVAALRSR